MMATETGEVIERTLSHEGSAVREFYGGLKGPVVVGIEATGSMRWFLELLDELGIECRVAIRRRSERPRRGSRSMMGGMCN
jgi:transposase